jgi:hypothetical protein
VQLCVCVYLSILSILSHPCICAYLSILSDCLPKGTDTLDRAASCRTTVRTVDASPPILKCDRFTPRTTGRRRWLAKLIRPRASDNCHVARVGVKGATG